MRQNYGKNLINHEKDKGNRKISYGKKIFYKQHLAPFQEEASRKDLRMMLLQNGEYANIV